MNILLDFIPFQSGRNVGGAHSFAKAVYDALVQRRQPQVNLFAVYDSSLSVGQQYDYRQLAKDYEIILVDIHKVSVCEQIQKYKIDVMFVAIGQFWANYDLHDIHCKTVMFIHDIFDCERLDNRLDLLIHDNRTESWQKYISRCSNLFTGRWKRQLNRLYSNIMPLYSAPNTIAFSVSDYSANAIRYYFPEVKKNIEVCYSPLKKVNVCESVENEILRELVSSGEPYLLMIAADRRYKNPQNMMKVFMKVAQEYPHLHLLTLRYGHTIHPRHHDIHFLSESDLENAYKHAHALFFGSFFEGFGYPPIEALKYGTPTVASNVTSIPEILGDAGIYFSPFYPADIYRAIQLVIQNRDMKRDVITRRYEEVTRRQEEDLRHLVDILLTP